MELMVVIGIIGIGLAIGIPVYNTTIKPTTRLNGAARQLYSDVQLARFRAISENVRCGVIFYGGPDRYLVFRDDTPSNSQYDAGEEVKTVNLASDWPNVRFDTSHAGSDGIGDGIAFPNNFFLLTTRGRATGPVTATTEDRVYLMNEKSEGREIVVNIMGGMRIEKY